MLAIVEIYCQNEAVKNWKLFKDAQILTIFQVILTHLFQARVLQAVLITIFQILLKGFWINFPVEWGDWKGFR